MKHIPFFALTLSLLSALTACRKANDSIIPEGSFAYTINGARYSTDDASIEMDTLSGRFSASFSNNKGELLLLEDGQFNKVPYQL